MRITLLAPTVLAVALCALAACGADPVGELPSVAATVKDAITDPKRPGPDDGSLEYRVFQLEDAALDGDVSAASCDAVDAELAQVCADLYAEGTVASCGYTTSFFYAHVTPRCAVRFESWRQSDTGPIHDVHVLDFAGTPLEGPVPGCGNGVLDEAEACDDGNHEAWDGCDANCNQEEFQGCEHVIEDVYQRAGVARVAADEWDGPRSHLMVNHGASALRPLDEPECTEAIRAADEVCQELMTQMPFVSYCQPAGQFHQEASEPVCSIRLQVWFDQLDYQTGVFTTSLPGLLAFTIR
ncbi:MAG: hypothetical protein HYS27_06355 [Deltaproteobacteria bacterium]|nr:hypothetical protein [Deltaproteobacteria bacterium]